MQTRPLALALALLAAAPAAAADLALVIGNSDYENAEDLRRGSEPVDAAEALRDAGIDVISVRDGELADLLSAASRFVQSAPDAERLLVVLSGRFASTDADAYLLPIETDGPPLALLPGRALPASVVLAVLGEAPGRSVLVLASDAEQGDFGPYVRSGYGAPDVPQGVTLVRADPRAARDLVRDVLAVPGEALAAGVAEIDGAEVSGFLPQDYAFLPAGRDRSRPEGDRAAQAWERARAADTIAAYEDYIDEFPRGSASVEARLRIDELRNDPVRRAELDERALDLGPDERRQIQRDLVLLGYDTRGIDGIFGPGTRAAVRDWQGDQGERETGYLTAAQVGGLARAATDRAAELEREAEERRAERAEEDRSYWRETGESGTAEGYRRYLRRFPDGLYAELAESRLERLDGDRRSRAARPDIAAWEEARAEDTSEAYERYLQRFPDGSFAGAARTALDRQDERRLEAELEAAAATERSLGLNPITARLVEERLKALGLEPGAVDGTLDERSRRAIRRYQSDRSLPVTGFLNQPTVVQLLADSVRQILD